MSVKLLQANPGPSKSAHKLNDAIFEDGHHKLVSFADSAPSEHQEGYHYMEELQKGLCCPCVLCTYVGGPVRT